MIQSLQWWKVIATLASLSIGARSLNSINIQFENIEDIDLSFLGTPNLDQYDAKLDMTVEDRGDDKGGCMYNFDIEFEPNGKETPSGDSNFTGNCQPNDAQGNATDGLPWHAHRRHWMKLSDDIFRTTGFDHFSMEWVPCGRAPAGFKQARWDLNFYTVIPEVRAFMVCDVFKTPSVCQYNQTSHLGRSMFSLPRLAHDPYYLANLPLDYTPDPEFPEAFPYEGLTLFDPELVPNTTADWRLPTFVMTTFDAAAVSWRAMIPQNSFIGKRNRTSSQWEYYVYQTMMGLPSRWSTYYDGGRMYVAVEGSVLEGAKYKCDGSVNPANMGDDGKDKIKIVFKESSNTAQSNAAKTKSSENMMN